MNKNKEIEISIVSPVYLAEKIVDKLVEEIVQYVSKITDHYEIILVEDGSPDDSWIAIENNCLLEKKVKGIKLSKNFGQHYAITAGLKAAKGEWIIVMDCDLQDKPNQIQKLYNKAKDGFDIVYARRVNRKDSFLKKLSSSIFYTVYRYLSGLKHDKTIANYGIYHRKVIDAFNQYQEPLRSFPSLVSVLGFKSTIVDVDHAGNTEDRASSYNFNKLLSLAIDVIIAHSNKPLKLAITLGVFIALIGFALAMFYLFRYFNSGITIQGYTSIIVSIWFLSGIIIMVIGVTGIYIGKVFDTVKARPLYIIDQKLGFDEQE